MIGTLEYAEILDQSETIGKMILSSDLVDRYLRAQRAMEQDDETQKKINAFIDIKEHHEDVERFGTYHPDYNEIMKQVRVIKREMDMDDKIAAFKVAERNLQQLLDEISQLIASSVSNQIKVPADNALFDVGGCSGCDF